MVYCSNPWGKQADHNDLRTPNRDPPTGYPLTAIVSVSDAIPNTERSVVGAKLINKYVVGTGATTKTKRVGNSTTFKSNQDLVSR